MDILQLKKIDSDIDGRLGCFQFFFIKLSKYSMYTCQSVRPLIFLLDKHPGSEWLDHAAGVSLAF